MNFRSLTSSTVLLLLACLILGLFVARPQWHKYTDAQAQLAALQTANSNLQDGLNSVQSFLSSYKSNSGNTQLVNQALPVKSSDMQDFVSSIDQMAQASGVLLSNLSVEEENPTAKPVPPNTIQAVVINMSASGNFASFKDLMLRMENYLRIVDINHVTLKADDTGTIEYQIDFRTYYQK